VGNIRSKGTSRVKKQAAVDGRGGPGGKKRVWLVLKKQSLAAEKLTGRGTIAREQLGKSKGKKTKKGTPKKGTFFASDHMSGG